MRPLILRTLTPVLIASAAMLAACDSNTARNAGQEAREAARQGTDAVADTSRDVAITSAVKLRLAQDPDLSALSINVDTEGGNVVLRGNAPNVAARTKASELANAVDGVRSVTNELNVQPPG